MILTYIQSIKDDSKRCVVEAVYDAYYKHMMACAQDILKNYHDAQDAVQDAFYNITATYELFEETNNKSTAALVHIYVKNAAINIYNRNKRYSKLFVSSDNVEETLDEVVDESSDVPKIVIDEETTKIVSEAIDQLDDVYRDLVIMKYYYHMKNTDIAKVVCIDSNKVNWRLYRARQLLKEIMGAEGYERITK